MNGFEKLHTENVRARDEEEILVLPIGAVEEQGPHLPLTVDTGIPVRVASLLVEKLRGFVAPMISYGARSLPQSGGGPIYPAPVPSGYQDAVADCFRRVSNNH